MLIRIVRMHFHETKVDEFLTIFEANKSRIRNIAGCTHLELLKDIDHPATYTTLSYWQSEKHLEAYRQSAFFNSIWSAVKILFSKKPEAFSLEQFIEL